MKKHVLLCLSTLFLTLVSCGNNGKSNTNNTDSITVESVDSTEQKKFDNEAIAQIMKLYNTAVLNPEYDITPIIERLCTDKLKRKLASAYDYEGEGYAVWEFRTGMQDGDGESKINSIIPLGGGWYEVDFSDMGWHGTKKIKAIEQNDKILIDDYK